MTKLHNYFEAYIEDSNGKVTKTMAFNIVTDYGIGSILSGNIYPANICLGNGEGTPSASDKSMFSLLGSYSATRDTSFDKDTNTCTVKLSFILDENTLKNTEISEIGIGSNGSLYTHALFTDSLGAPIKIYKGEFERMTVKAVAYIKFDAPSTGEFSNAIYYILKTVCNGNGNIAKSVKGAFTYVPKLKSGSYLPILLNKQAVSSAGYSNKKASVGSSLASGSGASLINAYSAYVIPTFNPASWLNPESYGAKPLGISFIEPYRSAKETLAVSDGITTQYSIPYKIVNGKGIKVYVDDVETNDVSIDCVGTTNVSSTDMIIQVYDSSNKKFIISEYRGFKTSSSSYASISVDRTELAYSIVTLNDDFEVIDIETGSFEPSKVPNDVRVPETGSLNGTKTQRIYAKPPYVVYSLTSHSLNGINYVDENGVHTKMCSEQDFIIDKDDKYTIITKDNVYTINPQTKEVSSKARTTEYFYLDKYNNFDMLTYKNSGESIIKSTYSYSYTTSFEDVYNKNTFEYTRNLINHAELKSFSSGTNPYNYQTYVDTENKIAIEAYQTYYSSGSYYMYVYVHFLSDDLMSIKSSKRVYDTRHNYGQLYITKQADNEFVILQDDDITYTVTIDMEGSTATCTRATGSNNTEYVKITNDIRLEDFRVLSNGLRVNTDFVVNFTTVPQEGAVIKFDYEIDSIDKTTDWTVSGSYSYGYEG